MDGYNYGYDVAIKKSNYIGIAGALLEKVK